MEMRRVSMVGVVTAALALALGHKILEACKGSALCNRTRNILLSDCLRLLV